MMTQELHQSEDISAYKQKLYIMANKSSIKIGISSDPERRRKQLSHAAGCEIFLQEVIETRSDPYEVEQALHKHYGGYRRDWGEWFHPAVLLTFWETLNMIEDRLGNIPDYKYAVQGIVCEKVDVNDPDWENSLMSSWTIFDTQQEADSYCKKVLLKARV